MNQDLEKYCWSVKLNHKFEDKLKQTLPPLNFIIGAIPLIYRFNKYKKECVKKGKTPIAEIFDTLKHQPIYGAPIGGIGAGTIGRSFYGDFCRFQLVPGLYEHNTVDANLFTVCIRKKSKTIYQQALTTRRPEQNGLKSWNAAYQGDQATYHALYPESWTVYNLPGQNVKLTCHQLSPVIPHNYKDSSLPVGLFNWTVENYNKEEIELSLMFTWQSGSASNKFELADVKSNPFTHSNYDTNISGVIISQKLRNMPLEYCISAKKNDDCEISYNCQFYPENYESGNNLWLDLLDDGKLDNKLFVTDKIPTNKASKLAIAVCVQIKVKPNITKNIEFSLAWNMPNVYFLSEPNKTQKRFYTRFFPSENPNTVMDISCYSIANQTKWINELNVWREPILKNKLIPEFLKGCLLNELYFISDGGSIWIDIDNEETCENNLIREYGRFAYLEGHEYIMFNTYDVHFYASYALLMLWPKLQQSLQFDFAATINQEINRSVTFWLKGDKGCQKEKNSIPHDIGEPDGIPWKDVNAYPIHNTNNWKDLNLKFILSVYRDYYYLKDEEYLRHMWPYIKQLMTKVESQDTDGDGLIDSKGEPDQTYDLWSITGASAYCGSLHLATLKVVCEIAKMFNETDVLNKYSSILKQAKESYDTKLWNGKYYKYDSSNEKHNDSIMADMCCGHWFLRSCGFKYDVFEEEKIKSCLETIFEYNVMKYGNGKLGAVNGMRPDGKIDVTSLQSNEMWIGVTNSLASLMIFEDMSDKAWKVTQGLYETLYNKFGLIFQTPEALCAPNNYRSLGYMRALCIWSILYAIEQKYKNLA